MSLQDRSLTSCITCTQQLCLSAVTWTCRFFTASSCGDTPSGRSQSLLSSLWWEPITAKNLFKISCYIVHNISLTCVSTVINAWFQLHVIKRFIITLMKIDHHFVKVKQIKQTNDQYSIKNMQHEVTDDSSFWHGCCFLFRTMNQRLSPRLRASAGSFRSSEMKSSLSTDTTNSNPSAWSRIGAHRNSSLQRPWCSATVSQTTSGLLHV